MLTLKFRYTAKRRLSGKQGTAIIGVVASGNLEVLLERVHLSQARGFFERALALDPGNIEALVGTATVRWGSISAAWLA